VEAVENWAKPEMPRMQPPLVIANSADPTATFDILKQGARGIGRFAALYVGAREFDYPELDAFRQQAKRMNYDYRKDDDETLVNGQFIQSLNVPPATKDRLLGFRSAATLCDLGMVLGLAKIARDGPSFAPVQDAIVTGLLVGITAYAIRKLISPVNMNAAYRPQVKIFGVAAISVCVFAANAIGLCSINAAKKPDIGRQISESCLDEGRSGGPLKDQWGREATFTVTKMNYNLGSVVKVAGEADEVVSPTRQPEFTENFQRRHYWTGSPIGISMTERTGPAIPLDGCKIQ
jgi:hypothetical protein